jgi:hypothetical protein
MPESILFYHQKDPIKLLCEINLKKLFPDSDQIDRNRFSKKWNDFVESDIYNKEIFELKGNRLEYQSEQLIPYRSDDRPTPLLVLGNPANHSVKEGMFFRLKEIIKSIASGKTF